MSCALFDAYPELGDRLPHLALGTFPTAIERVRGLLPERVELWIKREDRAGGVYGGNKVRKLEFLLAGPLLGEGATRVRRILTYGGYGSHHVLATALYAGQVGLEVDAVVVPQPLTGHARDTLQLAIAAGARLWPSAGYLDAPWQALRARWHGPRPLVIPPGASCPRGTLGWLSGGLEIAAQVRAGMAPRFDAVYVPMGSGGTVAGLWLGVGEAAAELVAVRVVPALVCNLGRARRLARRSAALVEPHLGRGHALPPPPALRLDGRWLGPGYGEVTGAAERAVRRAAAIGLDLETTYTGKALAALLADAQDGRLDGKRVLFLHTYNSMDLAALRAMAPARDALPPRLRRAIRRAEQGGE